MSRGADPRDHGPLDVGGDHSVQRRWPSHAGGTAAHAGVAGGATAAITDQDGANDRLAEFLAANAPVCVLTGAGLSAASGIATYRDEAGRWLRSAPIDARSFRTRAAARQRYWWRSAFGYPAFAAAVPNAGHRALTTMEARGAVTGVVTQNVDGLHQRAGSQHVVELHGNLGGVICLDCGARYPRAEIHARVQHLNAELFAMAAPHTPATQLADGDAERGDAEQHEATLAAQLRLPQCDCCAGTLEPAVVFFGGTIAPRVLHAADALLAASRGLLVVGSSLGVYAGLRLVRRARLADLPVVAINPGGLAWRHAVRASARGGRGAAARPLRGVNPPNALRSQQHGSCDRVQSRGARGRPRAEPLESSRCSHHRRQP